MRAPAPKPTTRPPAITRRRLAQPAPRPERPPGPALGPEDRAALRRSVALARELLHLTLDGAGGKRPLRLAFALNEELGALHRRIEPRLYGRRAGSRP